LPDGDYVYVQDVDGKVYVAPDGLHMHPRVLGGAQPAQYAGDMRLERGEVTDLTNLSGTFQFDDELGLREVAKQLRIQGLRIAIGAVRFFGDGSLRPVVLE
jgi:hypothetical protein